MNPQGTVAEVSGVKLRVSEQMARTVAERITSGNYEQDEMRGLQALVEPGDVVMEIGAGIGFLSAYCAKVVGSENTYAYEANPELERTIRDTYALNDVSPRLEICVLAHEPGERVFHIEESFLVSSLGTSGRAVKAVKVPAKLVAPELARIRPTVLMVDIEGGEYELLPGMDLSTFKKIVIELHPRNAEREKTRSLVSRFYEEGFVAYRGISHGDVLSLERRNGAPPRFEVLTLEEALHGLSSSQTDLSVEEVSNLVPEGEPLVVVDPENRWSAAELARYRHSFFMERDGVDWGAPADDAQALEELAGHRSRGVRYIAVLWTAFWWKDLYPRLFETLDKEGSCVLRNSRVALYLLPSA